MYEVYRFDDTLLSGQLLQRINRFVSLVALNDDCGNPVSTFCYMANPGSMLGMCTKGAEVRVSYSESLKRKFKHSIEAIKIRNTWIGCNTHVANRVVSRLFSTKHLANYLGFPPFDSSKSEVSYSSSRFDFKLHDSISNRSTLVEVKTVTMASDWFDIEANDERACLLKCKFPATQPDECNQLGGKIALFPDCQSVRALRHVDELAEFGRRNGDSLLIFIILRDDVEGFSPSYFCDPVYAKRLTRAVAEGVQVIAAKCRLNVSDCSDGKIELLGTVPLVLRLNDRTIDRECYLDPKRLKL